MLHLVIEIRLHAEAIHADINRMMGANMTAFNATVDGVIPTPQAFNVALSNKTALEKLYGLFVTLKLAQILQFAARISLTALIATGNAAMYIAPTCFSIMNSNFFTAALLSHAGFYSLSTANQAKILQIYKALDLFIAENIEQKPTLQRFDNHIKDILQGERLEHYTKVIGLRQKLAKAKTRVSEARLSIVNYEDQEALVAEIANVIGTAHRLEIHLAEAIDSALHHVDVSMDTTSSSSLSKSKADGAGGRPVFGSLSSSSSSSSSGGPHEEGEVGGNRSTRKRGSNKKGKTKSKRSPKSTRKGGRKQSARKIR